MRVCVAGGGLAGSLLAWRLARLPGVRVDLLLGPGSEDATAASGGAVRGFDRLPEQRELAIASLTELLNSPVLRSWAGYQEAGFAYLCEPGPDPADLAGLTAAVAEVERAVGGPARLVPAAGCFGAVDGASAWTGPEDVMAVTERRAGYISPARLRDAVLTDLAGREHAGLRRAALASVTAGPGGTARVIAGGAAGEYDVVVLATGAWTAPVLRASGLAAGGYRTKSIQYTVCEAGPWLPPPFADERTGLYGKPVPGGGLLLGVPTDEWGVPAGHGEVTPGWHEQAARLAAGYFPLLRLGAARARMNAADCYCDPPVLSLRPVPGPVPGLLTFTGGSGGAAKTALAASDRAALRIQGGLAGAGDHATGTAATTAGTAATTAATRTDR